MKKFLLPVSVITTLFILVACVADKNLSQPATNDSVLNTETTLIEEIATQESSTDAQESTTQEAVSENKQTEIISTTKEHTTEKQTDAVVTSTQESIEQTTILSEQETTTNITQETTTNITQETTTNITQETTTVASVDIISKDEEKKIVLKHAGLSEDDIIRFSIELDREFTGTKYDIDLSTNEYEYEYEIDAKNGNVIKYEKEAAKHQTKPETTTTAPETTTAVSETTTVANKSDTLISKTQAKQIVLNHAGVLEKDIRNYRIETDKEKNKTIYEVDFYSREFEYEYELDATNGNIIKSEKERID